MSEVKSVETVVGLAFSQLLKTGSEVVESLSAKDLSAEISCDVSKGFFKVQVCKVVPVSVESKIAELEALIVKLEPKEVLVDEAEIAGTEEVAEESDEAARESESVAES